MGESEAVSGSELENRTAGIVRKNECATNNLTFGEDCQTLGRHVAFMATVGAFSAVN